MIKLGYSTYALKEEKPASAIRRVREIGYEAIEITVSDGWPTAPALLDADARISVRDTIVEVGFPSPVLMNLMGVAAIDEDREAKLVKFAETCRLAQALNLGDRAPIVTTTLGRQSGEWEDARDGIVIRLMDYAKVAEGEGTTLALEPHVGQVFDTPEKAAWLMEQTDHPNLKLNFDYSHFHLLGIDLDIAIRLCGPHSVHTHIKDGEMVDGKAQFALPGEGSLDLDVYLSAVVAANLNLPVMVEVSRQISGVEGFDAWGTAEKCFGYLDEARKRL